MQIVLMSLSILMVAVVAVVSGVWVVVHRSAWWINALWSLMTCILACSAFPYQLYFYECCILFLWLFVAIQFMPRSWRKSSSARSIITILVAVILGAMMILRQDASHGWATVNVGGLRLELAFAGQGAV
jgi:hypothetical protein